MILQDYPKIRAQQKANEIGLPQTIYRDEYTGAYIIALNIPQIKRYVPECERLYFKEQIQPNERMLDDGFRKTY